MFLFLFYKNVFIRISKAASYGISILLPTILFILYRIKSLPCYPPGKSLIIEYIIFISRKERHNEFF